MHVFKRVSIQADVALCVFIYTCCLFTCLFALCGCLSVLLNGQMNPACSLCLEVDLMGFPCDYVSCVLL